MNHEPPYGNANSNRNSHAWRVNITCPDTPTDRCQPTVLSADLRCDCLDECFCVGDLLYRGACRSCGWEGEPVDEENSAAEDACDHAWPGWRELPVVARVPDDGKRHDAWAKRVAATYPTGWLAGGGPIRTQRSGVGTRHVPGRTPFGGYDMAVAIADAEGRRAEADPPAVRAPRSRAARPSTEPDPAATVHPDGPGRVAPGQRVTCLPGSLPVRDGGRGGGVLVSIGPKTSLVNVYGGRPRRIRNELLHPTAGPWIAADREARGLRTTTADGRGWLPS